MQHIVYSCDYWNNMIRDNGKSLYQDWTEADHSIDRILNDKMRLELFGKLHEYTNTLTNKGIQITIDKKKFTYMLYDDDFYSTIGMSYNIIYDPNDPSCIYSLRQRW